MEMERKMEMEKKVEGYTMVQKLRYCEKPEGWPDDKTVANCPKFLDRVSY